MFNKKQIDDAVRNNRKDVAAEIQKYYEDTEKDSEEQTRFYENASTEELYNLTVNGDDVACAYYIFRRVGEDTLTRQDITYLEASMKNLCLEASIAGLLVYETGEAGWGLKEQHFCHAILEQYGEKRAHKCLKKAYKKDPDLIEEIDYEVLSTSLIQYLASVKGRYHALAAELTRAKKDVIDHKSAYLLNLSFTEPNGRETDSEAVYTVFLRGKKHDKSLDCFIDCLSELLPELAEKAGIQSSDIYIDGSHRFHYGNTLQKTKNNTEDRVTIVSDAQVDIQLSDEGRLKSNVCAFCGGILGQNGICSACGKKSEEEEGGKIVIRREKATEALLCTQCGSPVELDENKKTAFCPACGTTFAVNGSMLTDGIRGLNYESIRADMPENAVFPDVQFMRASIAGDMVTAIMPKNFIVMSDKVRRIKYPANAPKFIYTTPDTTVNLTLNLLGPLREDQVFAFGQQMLASLKATFPSAIFDEAKKFTAPQNIFFVDFITAGLDQSIYNAMFFFSLNGKQGIGSWNCLGKDRWFWAPVFEHAVRTMEFRKHSKAKER